MFGWEIPRRGDLRGRYLRGRGSRGWRTGPIRHQHRAMPHVTPSARQAHSGTRNGPRSYVDTGGECGYARGCAGPGDSTVNEILAL